MKTIISVFLIAILFVHNVYEENIGRRISSYKTKVGEPDTLILPLGDTLTVPYKDIRFSYDLDTMFVDFKNGTVDTIIDHEDDPYVQYAFKK